MKNALERLFFDALVLVSFIAGAAGACVYMLGLLMLDVARLVRELFWWPFGRQSQ